MAIDTDVMAAPFDGRSGPIPYSIHLKILAKMFFFCLSLKCVKSDQTKTVIFNKFKRLLPLAFVQLSRGS